MKTTITTETTPETLPDYAARDLCDCVRFYDENLAAAYDADGKPLAYVSAQDPRDVWQWYRGMARPVARGWRASRVVFDGTPLPHTVVARFGGRILVTVRRAR